MFQRRRKKRDEESRKTVPLPRANTRRAFIRSIVDPSLVEVLEVPNLDRLRESDPDLAATLESIFYLLDGLVDDTGYLHREAPMARCDLTPDVAVMIADLKQVLDKVDGDKTFKRRMVVAVIAALVKLYGPWVYALIIVGVVATGSGWWTVALATAGIAVITAVAAIFIRRRRNR